MSSGKDNLFSFASNCFDFQAIVYQNERAVGRLISPKVSVAELSSKGLTPSDSEERGVAFEIISIEYNQWQPAWLRNKDQLKQLYLPVDQAFQASSFRIQVLRCLLLTSKMWQAQGFIASSMYSFRVLTHP